MESREQYLTLDQAAEHVGRNPRTIEQWVRRDQLAPARVGGGAGRPSLFALSEVVACDLARRSRRWHDQVDQAATRWSHRR